MVKNRSLRRASNHSKFFKWYGAITLSVLKHLRRTQKPSAAATLHLGGSKGFQKRLRRDRLNVMLQSGQYLFLKFWPPSIPLRVLKTGSKDHRVQHGGQCWLSRRKSEINQLKLRKGVHFSLHVAPFMKLKGKLKFICKDGQVQAFPPLIESSLA